MKEIKRGNFPPIIKREIDLSHIISYCDLDLEMIHELLNEVITNYTYSTIDLLKLLKERYQGSHIDTIRSIQDYSEVRFNCYYATTRLKEKLEEHGVRSNLISYKSIGFSTSSGDRLIKEAHMALLIPTVKNQELYYVILDPGLRIPSPIEFYWNRDRTVLQIDHDEIVIEKTTFDDYPYTMKMKGYNRYSTNSIHYQSQEFFDVRYETLNPIDVLFPISYHILSGYRIINYSIDASKGAFIKLMMIDGFLECCDHFRHIQVPFHKLEQWDLDLFIETIEPFTKKLNINKESLADTILFILDHRQEFLGCVIDPQILMEYRNSVSDPKKPYIKIK